MEFRMYELRNDYNEYTVQKGDTLYAIAKKYGTTIGELMDTNMLTSNVIYPGQVLIIPKENTMDYELENYTVKHGDTISSIAKKLGIEPSILGTYNDFSKIVLAPNQIIKVPRTNTYLIKANDTVDSVLTTTNRTADELLRANATTWLKSGNRIYL